MTWFRPLGAAEPVVFRDSAGKSYTRAQLEEYAIAYARAHQREGFSLFLPDIKTLSADALAARVGLKPWSEPATPPPEPAPAPVVKVATGPPPQPRDPGASSPPAQVVSSTPASGASPEWQYEYPGAPEDASGGDHAPMQVPWVLIALVAGATGFFLSR